MTDQKVFIGACFPDEKSEENEGAHKVARTFYAKDIKHAHAKLAFLFVEDYPDVSDAGYKQLVCGDAPGMLRPALDVWDENSPENSEALRADEGGAPSDHESSDAAGETPEKDESSSSTEEPRKGPFYYRNEAGEVSRANKLPALERALAEGHIEIGKEEYLARKNGRFSEPEASCAHPEPTKQPEVKSLGAGKFSVEGLTGEPSKAEKATSNEVEKAENQGEEKATLPKSAHAQDIAESIEKEIAEKSQEAQDKLGIWRQVQRTDPRFTKDLSGAGFEGTSINAEYMIMRCTEIFGPIGIGWGCTVIEDDFLNGAPMVEAIYENDKFVRNQILRNGDGSMIFEQHHSMKIELWYDKDAWRGRVEAYGATPYMYKSKRGIICDGEVKKKSLTDAIKKALSTLGFSADVWLGLFDSPEYQAENKVEFAIKNASDKAEDVTRLREELDDKMTRVAATIEKSVSTNEAKKVYGTLAREVDTHRKAAEAKGDTEHARYLSGRLRRLNQIKDQRIKELTETKEEAQEQTA